MSISWSKEQEEVIASRDCNLLVSAAAGSGKTAVLVQRIIELITDPREPMDVDRLLVVTFTNAAAAEMKERLGREIEKLRASDPQNENLIRQSSLLHHARICTIDSFCLYVLQNHFGEIGMDPEFRIADEGELRLLEKDVMEALFEEEYALQHDTFLYLTDAYSGKRSDEEVRSMVGQIHRSAMSCPWPKEWIEGLLVPYSYDSVEELEQSQIMREAAEGLRRQLLDIAEGFRELQSMAVSGSIAKYSAALAKDCDMFAAVSEDMAFGELVAFLPTISFDKFPSISKKDPVDPALREFIKNGRDDLKKKAAALCASYGNMSGEVTLRQSHRLYPYVKELLRLALLFDERLQAAKRRRRIIDFSDLEHMALRILVDDKTKLPTETAGEFARYFREIMIDEYQDSNMIQEEILTAVSSVRNGRYNLFMVGDVKQSIYRFRQARPELFMDKYDSYTTTPGCCHKIELHSNYRSRKEVIGFANDLCFKLMARDLGGVAYDDAAALYAQASYPDSCGMKGELLLGDQKELMSFLEQKGETADENDKIALEARIVASRIRKIMDTMQITDKETGALRPARYSDIVLLFRSLRNVDTVYQRVLEEYGIPAHVESRTGYFDAYEIQTTLNLLRILDNPYQDIPMAAVLRSPYAGLDSEELAQIRLDAGELSYAEAALLAMKKEDGESTPIRRFGELYTALRRLSRELPIHELIQQILRITGFADIAASMPFGERRIANLDMLVEKAIAFEKTSYKGLFHFIRYIDQLQKYEQDFGEADLSGENADVVHIMTIHKSKGLEFPVVFVCQTAKQFNEMDSRSNLVLHPDLGLGLIEISAEPRIRKDCLIRTQIADRLERENLGEELRILYVALTRAKEKLIITGLVPDSEKMYKKYRGFAEEKKPLPFAVRRDALSYLDWIIPAVMSYPDRYAIEFVEPSELFLETVERQAAEDAEFTLLLQRIDEVPEEAAQDMWDRTKYLYPYASDITKKSKYSVSELKHLSMVMQYDRLEGETEAPEFMEKKRDSVVPAFARREAEAELDAEKDGQLSLLTVHDANGAGRGALRGTAVHRAMECLSFAALLRIDRKDRKALRCFVEQELLRMKESGELTAEMYDLIPTASLVGFLQQDFALRMAEADAKGLLFKEKPFVMEQDGVLIQGIIDVFWFEEDHIVLLDYKTDRIEKPEELLLRYSRQMELYADALGRIFSDGSRNRQVCSCILYSFRLQQPVEVLPQKERG